MRKSPLFQFCRIGLLSSIACTLSSESGRAQFTVGPQDGGGGAQTVQAAPQIPENTLARVGERDFTLEELNPYLSKLKPEERAALEKDPKKKDQFIRTFLVKRLLLEEAMLVGWDKKPEAEAQLQRIRENAIADGYLSFIAQPAPDFPSEAQVQAAYDANKAALVVPRELKLAQIFIACPAKASAEEKSSAESRVKMITETLKDPKADFAKIAQVKSNEPETASRGGEIGWVTEAQIHPEIRTQAMALSPGMISAPIRAEIGWIILKALDERPSRTMTLEEVRPALVKRMRELEERKLSEQYLGKLVQKQPIAINNAVLTKALTSEK